MSYTYVDSRICVRETIIIPKYIPIHQTTYIYRTVTVMICGDVSIAIIINKKSNQKIRTLYHYDNRIKYNVLYCLYLSLPPTYLLKVQGQSVIYFLQTLVDVLRVYYTSTAHYNIIIYIQSLIIM